MTFHLVMEIPNPIRVTKQGQHVDVLQVKTNFAMAKVALGSLFASRNCIEISSICPVNGIGRDVKELFVYVLIKITV